MNFKEVQRLLKMMNVDMNEDHALRLFQVSTAPEGLEGLGRGWNKLHNTSLQKDVVTFFCLSARPSIRSSIHLAIHLFVHPTTCLPRETSISSFICQPNQPRQLFLPPVHLSIQQLICPPS